MRSKPLLPTPSLFAALMVATVGCGTSRDSLPVADSTEVQALDTAWVLPHTRSDLGDIKQVIEIDSGHTLVVDETARSVRRFDAQGNFLGEVVTSGRGPLQAEQPYYVTHYRDTLFLAAEGPASGLVTWVNIRDRSSGTFRLASRDRTVLACGAASACLARRGAPWQVGSPFERAGTSRRDSLELGWIDRRVLGPVEPVAWFSRHEGPLVVSFEWPRGPIPVGSGTHEFSLGAQLAVSSTEVWVLSEAENRLYVWTFGSPDANLVPLPELTSTLDAASIADTTEARVARAPSPLAKSRTRATRDLGFLKGRGMPVTSGLVPGRDGTVWVRLFADGERETNHYLPATRVGVEKQTIAVPGDISVLFVGDSLVYGAIHSDSANTSLIALRLRGPRAAR